MTNLMAIIPKFKLLCYFGILFLVSVQFPPKVLCSTYKVGDLDGWGTPTSSNPQVYTKWSKSHNFKIGDSIFFLYPPSQDSVIQVTKESYKSCNLKDPIVYMNNGNSLFNITSLGEFYFTSGEHGHCGKSQKLHIMVGVNGSYADDISSPASGPSASAPSYPTVFGAIPIQASSHSPSSITSPLFCSALTALFIFLFASARI